MSRTQNNGNVNRHISAAQLPHVDRDIMPMTSLPGTTNDEIFNNDIHHFNYRPVLMESSERSHYFNKYDNKGLAPGNKSHPLARYSSQTGYFDPNWESLENDRLAYHASLSNSIISSLRNKSKYNVLVDCFSNENIYKDEQELRVGPNTRRGLHEFELNTDVGNSFDRTFNGIHEENRYSINDTHGTSSMAYGHKINDPNSPFDSVDYCISAGRTKPNNFPDTPKFNFSSQDVKRNVNIEHSNSTTVDIDGTPLFPEIRPYINREGANHVDSRRPAGSNFSTVNTNKILGNIFESHLQTENFRLTPCTKKDNADFCAILTKKEMDDINSYLYGSSKKESFSKNNTSFENEIAEEADYTYMSALKVRANAVCEYLRNNRAYSSWKSNWNLLYSNLNHGKLFERLGESEADIAYVINKGSEVKFRIRDHDRYVPINTYQYVLYHEMAHMSTKELQHTPGFMKLLNIISLAAFECGFIDFRKLSSGYYMTNGSPILCRSSMKEEVCLGAEWLREANPNSAKYYDGIIEAVRRA